MWKIVLLLILLLVVPLAAGTGMRSGPLRKGALTVSFLLLGTLFAFSITTQVPDGHAGIVRSFGKYEDVPLQPGISLIAPWKSVTDVDTRVQSFTFSDTDSNSVGGSIPAQALGGGNLTIDLTIQAAPSTETAPALLKTVGDDWFTVIGRPAARSCVRDAPTDLTVEESYTTGRPLIAERILACFADKVELRGIKVFDVLLRDVDPGAQVRQAIDDKQQAQQELQRAAIRLQQEELTAQQEAVKAFGISQAEQIVACGGVQSTDENGNPSIKPNDECGDQFSTEYLQWLYINQLSQVDGVVILPPEFDGQLFVSTPPPSQTAQQVPATD